MSFTIDPIDKLIFLDNGIVSINALDIYSGWKRWIQESDNAKYEPAFSNSIGGDPLGGGIFAGSYFFLRNDLGWRVRPHEANHELTVNGNLYGSDPNTAIFTQTLGDYTVMIRLNTSSLTQVSVSGSLTESTQQSVESIEKILRNKTITNPSTGVMTVYDNDNVTPLYTANIYEDAAGAQPYDGQGAERRDRLE